MSAYPGYAIAAEAGAPIIAHCGDMDAVERALRNDTPFYVAFVSTPVISAIQAELDTVLPLFPANGHASVSFNPRGMNFSCHGDIDEDLKPRLLQMMLSWREINEDIHTVPIVDIWNTQGRENVTTPHIDRGTVSILSTGPRTRFHATRAFSDAKDTGFPATHEECPVQTPEGYAAVFRGKGAPTKKAAAHAAPFGARLSLVMGSI